MFIKRIDLDSQLIFDKETKNRCSAKFLLLFLLFMSCFAVTFAQQETDSRSQAQVDIQYQLLTKKTGNNSI